MSDETKLPQWARRELQTLRNRIGELERDLSVAREEAPNKGATGIVLVVGLGVQNGFPLHDRTCIEFKLPNGKITAMLRENGTLLDLNSSGTMLINPRASNSAYVKIDER